MKSKNRTKFLIGLLIFFISLTVNNNIEKDNLGNVKKPLLKNNGFWDLTSPIFIDDNDQGYNWSKTANGNDWCSGSGTWNDPYVIENVTIDGQNSNSCIEIRNSNVYFKIKNCTAYNSSQSEAGIKLYNVNNSKLINNNCSFNNYVGFLLTSCNNNTIAGNTASNNTNYGTYLSQCNNNTIAGNTFSNNMLFGTYLSQCNNNTFVGNNASNNLVYGTYLSQCNNNKLFLNNITTNSKGGLLLQSSNETLILENVVTKNELDGIYLINSHFNNITENIVNNTIGDDSGNTGNGIRLDNCNNIILYKNIASSNEFAGIYLNEVNNVSVTNNTMYECGLIIDFDFDFSIKFESYSIDHSNSVNDKKIYFYYNKTGLNSNNFTNAGQLLLINCNNSLVSNINLVNCSNGIYLYSSNNNTIFNNTLSYNSNMGISLNYFSNKNNLSGNIITDCEVKGISITESNYNNITNNILKGSDDGIFLAGCNETLVSYNIIDESRLSAIYSTNTFTSGGPPPPPSIEYDLTDIVFIGNNITRGGFYLIHSDNYQNNYFLDKTNLVNGKPVYYYIDKNNLDSNNFSNPGQIILHSCNNTSLTDFDFFETSCGIQLENCINNSISNINCSDITRFGVFLVGCRNNNISNINIERVSSALPIRSCNNTYLSDCNIKNSEFGLIIALSNYLTITRNLFNNNTANNLYSNSNCSITNNTFSDNYGTGIRIFMGEYINFTDNFVANNTLSGLEFNVDYGIVSKNIIKDNLNIGIELSSSSNDVLIFNNVLIGNKLHAKDDGVNNRWDNDIMGNFWDNYTDPIIGGVDVNPLDGIGDLNFTISGIANANDTKPIFENPLPGVKIYIDGTGVSAINWTQTSLLKWWLSGSGTGSSPYIIENMAIDANSSGSPIKIMNSNSSFIIRNCTLFNAESSSIEAGINLKSVNNGKIFNNTCTLNLGNGIYLDNCFNNTIIKNKFNNNFHNGICIVGCVNISIINNTINHNEMGIYMFKVIVLPPLFIPMYVPSFNISILENEIYNHTGFGIFLHSTINSYVSKNNVSLSINGILLLSSNDTLVTNNRVEDCNFAAIFVGSGNNLNFSENLMISCGIIVSGEYSELSTYSIDTSNKVNGKPVYFYLDSNNLDNANYLNPGQIILVNCNSSNISEISISNSAYALDLWYCNDVSILDCNFSDNYMGIRLEYSNNNSISRNIIDSNTYAGIGLYGCNNTLIYWNNISNNYDDLSPTIPYQGGPPLSRDEIGIKIWYDSNNNTIYGNTINNNKIGIYITKGANNTIEANNITENYEFGVFLESFSGSLAESNLVYCNIFNNNGMNALDNGTTNMWDDGFTGNYWDDYIGPDIDQNGIGDTLYFIIGSAIANDTRPILFSPFEDTDGDGLSNYEEYNLGQDNYRTNVTNTDSDYDGLSDYWEWGNSTNPLNSDTDSDNMPDRWEIFNSLNPLANDAMDDADFDLLLNLYEYLNGTDPYNNDTDGDTFLDGTEADPERRWWTDPLDKWWYPMPNLEIISFRATTAEFGKPFTLNFTITNNGIWRAENVIIVIWIELLNITIYTNIGSPINLEVDQQHSDIIQIIGVNASGGLLMKITLDPLNLINETYSSKDGTLRDDAEGNWKETTLGLSGDPPAEPPEVFDPFLLFLIIFAIAAISIGISLFIILKPKIKRRFALKRQLAFAKTDIENFEINMHSFIKVQLQDFYKSSWWEEGIPGYIRSTIDGKINIEKPRKEEISVDKMDLLDFSHITPIITEKNNWKDIFSETFPDKNVVEENIEKLRVFKISLDEGTLTPEEMMNYPLYIHAIRTYFTRGYNVFFSYSTLDADYFKIEEVAKRLESYPRIDKVFYWETDSGESIVTYMERTLRLSKIFVFFCSENSMKSKAVEDEWQAAFQMRKKGLMKIVPVFEKEDLIPFLLSPLLNVKYSEDDFDGFIEKLHEGVLR